MKRLVLAFLIPIFLVVNAYAASVGRKELLGDGNGGYQTLTSTTNSNKISLREQESNYFLWLDADHQSGTSPTLDVKLQTSPNGTDWVDVPNMAFPQVTTTDKVYGLPLNEVEDYLLSYVRVVCTLGGTSPDYDVLVTLNYRRK